MSSALETLEALRRIAAMDWSERSILADALPPLVEALGEKPAELRFEHLVLASQTRIRLADAALIAEDGRALVVFEVKGGVPEAWWDDWSADLAETLGTSAVSIGLLVNPHRITILWFGERTDFSVPLATEETAGQLHSIFRSAIADARPTPPDHRPPSGAPDCLGMIQRIETATTNDEKKKALETFAAWMVDRTSGLKVKHHNLRTTSSEIDLVVENVGAGHRSVFDEFGRHLLVECKNWGKPVGAKEVRDFVGKLLKTDATLGLLISKNGVTGKNGAEDALREIRFCYDRLDLVVCVLALEDLRAICLGSSLGDLVDERVDRLRFDLR